MFLSPQLALGLLGGHLLVLLIFCNYKWCWYTDPLVWLAVLVLNRLMVQCVQARGRYRWCAQETHHATIIEGFQRHHFPSCKSHRELHVRWQFHRLGILPHHSLPVLRVVLRHVALPALPFCFVDPRQVILVSGVSLTSELVRRLQWSEVIAGAVADMSFRLRRLMILLGIEVAFNVFPATWWSSAVLQACHWVLLVALFFSPASKPPAVQSFEYQRKTA